jgi:hypothetical protein
MKQAATASGSSSENTRPTVSCDGMPFGRSNTFRSHSSFALPKSSIRTKPSAPQITARMLRMMMSRREWRRVRSIRGSVRPSKASTRVGMKIAHDSGGDRASGDLRRISCPRVLMRLPCSQGPSSAAC